MAWMGKARFGTSGHGPARHGVVGEVGFGMARHGEARRDTVR